MGQRQPAVDETRTRIIAAARKLIMSRSGFADFSVDAVARQAGVARMTVYYQFKSKVGLLEALFDDIAARGEIKRISGAFANPEPRDALAQCIAIFGRFWTLDRVVIRMLRAMATLDPDFEKGLRGRDARRLDGIRILLQRLADQYGRPDPKALDDAVDLVAVLTSFGTFDHLAGPARKPEAVVPIVTRLVFLALGLDRDCASGRVATASIARKKMRLGSEDSV
jgi:AcrR family transcriptional regulator